MRITVLLVSMLFSVCSLANNIIVNGTRFIYEGGEKEMTIQMTNTADRPAIVQSWLDNGNPNETPDTIKTPFQITPPIARVEAKGGQVLRIKLMNKDGLPTDRESLWWLNILDIPSISKKGSGNENVLQLAIRSRFKFFYRPAGLTSVDSAINQLTLSAKGRELVMNNPSPFYLTVTKISIDGQAALNEKTVMIAPYAKETIQLKKSLKVNDPVLVNSLNDYGANIKRTITVK